MIRLIVLVGVRGFETPTSSSRTMRATKRRQPPTERVPVAQGSGMIPKAGVRTNDQRGRLAPERPHRARKVLQRPPARIGSTDRAATPDAAAMIANTIGSP